MDSWEEEKANKEIGAAQTGVEGSGGKALKQLKTTEKGKSQKTKGGNDQFARTASNGNSDFEGNDEEISVDKPIDSSKNDVEKQAKPRQHLTRSMDVGQHNNEE